MAVEINPLVLLGAFAASLLAPTLTVYLLLAYRLESGLQEVREELTHEAAQLRRDLEEHAAGERERVEDVVSELVGTGGALGGTGPTAPSASQEVFAGPPQEDPAYLVVDDSGSVLKAVERFLVEEGVDAERIITAANASEALEIFREHRPEIVLLDVELPDLDGDTVARQIQALDPEVRIVAITSLDPDDPRVRALQELADEHLRKPVERGDVADLDKSVAPWVTPRDDPENPEPE